MDVMGIVERIAQGLEYIGVAVIACAFVHALARGALHGTQRRPDAYERLRQYLGRALMLGLEFLVAADIIRTVTAKPTMEGLSALALLVGLRIVLGWSIAVELEGCWPWRAKEEREKK